MMGKESSNVNSSRSNKKAPARVSYFLELQQELQKNLRCDYVLLWYQRDPQSPVGQCPKFLRVGEPIPVKLSHHAFMQMAFGILKDRLLNKRTAESDPTGTRRSARAHKQPDGAGKISESAVKGEKNAPSEGSRNLSSTKEQNTVAMFCFLWQYVTKMLRSQEEALALARKCRTAGGAEPRPTVRMTKQQLRLQMLLEYGVDVQKVLGDGLSTEGAVREEFCRSLVTGVVSEEEFLQQLAKPAGMAQTCSIM
uniref:Uncharacterized protein TCIL3000_11_15060 n=1 Tax=Trypanosoma congolense (strain IL3000) TaxID=1068625 RepID=G0V2W6_TRYCI|nr:unnamed protein product [Trypanosoma congolense IL3000]